VQNRARCVRVIYKADPPYHIDLAVYVMEKGVPQLFDKEDGKSPYESNPLRMNEWFTKQTKKSAQVRRLTRYAKAWKDYNKKRGTSVASGLALTILTAEQLVLDSRDDAAFASTIESSYSRLKRSPSIEKPVTPFTDLTAHWTAAERADFIERLKQLRDRSQDALNCEDTEDGKSEASGIWRQMFGERFPEFKPSKKQGVQPLKTAAPAVLGNSNRSA
jgi:hypothetical protein